MRNHSIYRSALVACCALCAAFLLSCGEGSKKPQASSEASAASAAPVPAAEPQAPAASAAAPKELTPAEKEARAKALAEQEAKAKEKAEAERAAKDKAAQSAASKAEAVRLAALDVGAPVIATAPGVFASGVTVSIQAPSLKEAVVAYTLDGSEPSPTKGIRYASPFAVSSSAIVRAIAYIPGGKKSPVVSADYTIGEVCAAAGSSGDGRRSAPIGSVRAALDKARSLGIGSVKLASGTFEETVVVDAPIALSGGWKADFSGASGVRTAIQGKTASSSSKKAPAYALKAVGKAADGRTRFERIEFRGPDSSYGAGILAAEGAAPEFSDCAFVGGDGSYGYGAVSVSAASPVFRSCRLSGGGGATSYGLSVDGASAIVENSLLTAGTGTVGGYGLTAIDAKVTVVSSVLAANSANVGYGAGFYNSKGSRLERCTIVGGTGKDVSGVFISASDPAIDKCVIAAAGSVKSYGVTANYGDSAPSLLSGSVFLGCTGGVYYEAQTKTAYPSFNADGRLAGADGRVLAKPQGSGNSVGKFDLGAAPSYALPAGVDAGARSVTSR